MCFGAKDEERRVDEDTEHEPTPVFDGQTSISDHLAPTPATTPVEVRAPTDIELAAFLSAGTA